MSDDEMTLDAFRALAAEVGFDPGDPHLTDLYPDVRTLRSVQKRLWTIDHGSDEPVLIFRAEERSR